MRVKQKVTVSDLCCVREWVGLCQGSLGRCVGRRRVPLEYVTLCLGQSLLWLVVFHEED